MKTEGETLILCLGVSCSCLGVVCSCWEALQLFLEGQGQLEDSTFGVSGSSVSDSDSELESSENEKS